MCETINEIDAFYDKKLGRQCILTWKTEDHPPLELSFVEFWRSIDNFFTDLSILRQNLK